MHPLKLSITTTIVSILVRTYLGTKQISGKEKFIKNQDVWDVRGSERRIRVQI